MRQLLLFSLFILLSLPVAADSYRQVELKYRNAISLQSRLLPLLGDNVSVVSEGNSLLLRGPSAELNQLLALIKKLDKPRQQLHVFIYRGVDPELDPVSHGSKTWSTNRTSINRRDEAVVEEETTLVITDNELLSIPQEIYREQYQRPFIDVGNESIPDKVVEGVYQSRYQHNKLFEQESSVALTPALLADGNIAFTIQYSIPVNSQSSRQKFGSQATTTTRVSAYKQVKTHRTAQIDQWINLSSHRQSTYRPSLNTKKKVVSTQSKDDVKQDVWIKFSLLK